jgi:hypothetical protein
MAKSSNRKAMEDIAEYEARIVRMEMEVEDIQEIISTIEATHGKILWVLENRPPTKEKAKTDLEYRCAHLNLIALRLTKILSDRALSNQDKVVKIGGKK